MGRVVKLGEVLEYEQPTKYIVKSTTYSDNYSTPVLTAGQTFILGYTNETDGVFKDVPVIIFDDFTTAIKYVDFPFKVKSSAMKILKAKESEADIKYLYYKMQTIRNDNTEHKRYWISKYAELEIPLPSLSVQKKIAAILDTADELRQKDKALVAKYDELAQALFLEMFGDPVINPKGWVTQTLGDLCDVGSSKRVFLEELVDSGIPFYRGTEIGQMSDGQEITPTLFITKDHYDKLKEQTGAPKIGDLLMPSICPDGRILRVSNNKPFYFKDGRVLWIKTNNAAVNSYYLQALLKSIFRTNYSNIASGTTFAELKIVALKKIKILTPPIDIQNLFEENIMSVEKLKELAKVSALKSEELFNSLLQKAFNGELT